MKKEILFTLILILCHGSSFGQVLNGKVVDGIPVSVWNNIANGWSACEAIVKSQRETILEQDRAIKFRDRELGFKDSTETDLRRIIFEDSLTKEKQEKAIEGLNKQLAIPCPKGRPFLLTPWPYVAAGAGFLGGVIYGVSR